MIRNDQKVIDSIYYDENDAVRTRTGCIIRIPARYLDKGLANLGEVPDIMGIYQMILPSGEYSVSLKLNMYQLATVAHTFHKSPTGEQYIQFTFEKSDPIFKSHKVIANKIIVYNVFESFIDRGYVPDFMEYDDMLNLFRDIHPSTLNFLGANPSIVQSIVAHCARHPNDLTKLYRTAVHEGYKGKPAWIAFSSVIHGPKTAFAKLNGSYFNTASIAALTDDNDQPERIEELLRR